MKHSSVDGRLSSNNPTKLYDKKNIPYIKTPNNKKVFPIKYTNNNSTPTNLKGNNNKLLSTSINNKYLKEKNDKTKYNVYSNDLYSNFNEEQEIKNTDFEENVRIKDKNIDFFAENIYGTLFKY